MISDWVCRALARLIIAMGVECRRTALVSAISDGTSVTSAQSSALPSLGCPRSLSTPRQVVDRTVTSVSIHVVVHIRQFVQQAELEILDPVIEQARPDHRSPIVTTKRM